MVAVFIAGTFDSTYKDISRDQPGSRTSVPGTEPPTTSSGGTGSTEKPPIGHNGPGRSRSVDSGATGLLLFFMAVAGSVVAVNTLQEFAGGDEGQKFSKELQLDKLKIKLNPLAQGNILSGGPPLPVYDQNIGMAAMVLGPKYLKKFDEDHDYSRDIYREDRDQEEADQANKLSAYYKQEKLRREREDRLYNQQRAPHTQVQHMHYVSPPTVNYPPMAYYHQAQQPPLNQFGYQLVSPQYPAKTETTTQNGEKYGEFPYAPGHLLRDDTPYGMILVVCIILYLAALTMVHEYMFMNEDGTARKPKREELTIVELIRVAGATILSFVTYSYVSQLIQNYPGTMSRVVAMVAGGSVFYLGYIGSARIVESAINTTQVLPQCQQFRPEVFVNDADYLMYLEASQKICSLTYEDMIEDQKRSYQEEWNKQTIEWKIQRFVENTVYYFPFFAGMVALLFGFVFMITKTYDIRNVNQLYDKQLQFWGMFFVWLTIVIYVPYYGILMPWEDKAAARELERKKLRDLRQIPLDKLTYKLTTLCLKECTQICVETLNKITIDANKSCVS